MNKSLLDLRALRHNAEYGANIIAVRSLELDRDVNWVRSGVVKTRENGGVEWVHELGLSESVE